MFYLLEIVNNARTPIDIGGPLLIRAADRRRGRVDDAGLVAAAPARRATCVTITGPFPPGKTIAQVGFSLPQAGASDHDPADVAGGAGAGLRRRREDRQHADVVAAAHRRARDELGGQPFIMATGGRLNAGETLVLNLTGLPAHSHDAAQRGADRGGRDLRRSAPGSRSRRRRRTPRRMRSCTRGARSC